MGAYVILISVKAKVAMFTCLPLAVVTDFVEEKGYPKKANLELLVHLAEHFKKEYAFFEAFPDTVMESDAHGQLSADDVKFDTDDKRGYEFDYSNF
jgi:hypothetical protein